MKQIPGWPDYFCDEYGHIYSVKVRGGHKKNVQKPKMLIPFLKVHPNGKTRKRIELWQNGLSKTFYVSNLILLAFIGKKPWGMVVCHGANGTMDDSTDNLYYASQSQNIKEDRIRDGTFEHKKTPQKLNAEQVRVIRRLYDPKFITQESIAKIFNINEATVSSIVNRRKWKHI